MTKRTRRVEAPECGILHPKQLFTCGVRGYHFTDQHGDQVHVRAWGSAAVTRTASWTTTHPDIVWNVGGLAPSALEDR